MKAIVLPASLTSVSCVLGLPLGFVQLSFCGRVFESLTEHGMANAFAGVQSETTIHTYDSRQTKAMLLTPVQARTKTNLARSFLRSTTKNRTLIF